jgi:antibiotic biosynthesis monooxygenase (ABM) superfamily enzyme
LTNNTSTTDKEPATLLYSWEVQPGKEQAFMDWVHGVTEAASRWPGYLGNTTLKPQNNNGLFHSVVRFDNHEHAEAWLNSPERQEWVNKLKGIARVSLTKTSGLETWFELPGNKNNAPPRWKMVVVTFIAVYPLSLLLNDFVSPHLTHTPLPVRSLVFPLVLPVVLTYFFMPFLTQKVFRHWLYRDAGKQSH